MHFFSVSSPPSLTAATCSKKDEGHFRKLAQCGITVWVFRLEQKFFVMPKMLKGRKDKSETFAWKNSKTQKKLKNDLVILSLPTNLSINARFFADESMRNFSKSFLFTLG